MKVVIQSDSRIWGGNEKWLLLAASGLAARGHDILMSCRRGSPVHQRSAEAGLRVTHARPAGDVDVLRAFAFMRMLRIEKPDVVLLSAFKRSFWGGWAARKAGVPRVIERMGIERTLPRRWKYQHAFRHYIDGLIVNSTLIRDRWLESAPWFPADEVHVVLNGVHPPTASHSTLRDELQLGAATPIIAAAGRLEARKGFDLLLRAFSMISAQSAHLVIAGDGPDEPALRSQAEALGIRDRVHFLGFRTDMENVLLAADVFVLSSRVEGMANVMLEAMAADCLIVATDISGVREAIGEYNNRPRAGWIVPVDDAAAMADGMSSAIICSNDRPQESAAMRSELRRRIEMLFSPAANVAATERVLLGARGIPSARVADA